MGLDDKQNIYWNTQWNYRRTHEEFIPDDTEADQYDGRMVIEALPATNSYRGSVGPSAQWVEATGRDAALRVIYALRSLLSAS